MITLTNEEIVKAIQESKDGAERKRLMTELWNINQGIIYTYAYRYSTALSVPLVDVIQESYIALVQAVKYYDSTKSYKFTTYLSQTIKSVPTRLHGYDDTISLNATVGENEETELSELIEDTQALEQFQDSIYLNDLSKYIHKALGRLEPLQYDVITSIYFNDDELQAIADRLTITREKVRQIRDKALRELRKDKELEEVAKYYY